MWSDDFTIAKAKIAKSAGIATHAAYTITGGSATNAGSYNATVALNDKSNHEWEDGESDDLLLPWSIAEPDDTDPIFSNRENPIIGRIGVQTMGNTILLSNLPSNARVEVYNIQGKRIHSAHTTTQTLQIQVQTKGVYVVKAGNQTLRIAVK